MLILWERTVKIRRPCGADAKAGNRVTVSNTLCKGPAFLKLKSLTNDTIIHPIRDLRLIRLNPGSSNLKTEAMTFYVLLMIVPFMTAAITIIVYAIMQERKARKKPLKS